MWGFKCWIFAHNIISVHHETPCLIIKKHVCLSGYPPEFWVVIMDGRKFFFMAQLLSLAEHPATADMYNEIISKFSVQYLCLHRGMGLCSGKSVFSTLILLSNIKG